MFKMAVEWKWLYNDDFTHSSRLLFVLKKAASVTHSNFLRSIESSIVHGQIDLWGVCVSAGYHLDTTVWVLTARDSLTMAAMSVVCDSIIFRKKVVYVVGRQVAFCWGNPRIASPNPGFQSVPALRAQSTGSGVRPARSRRTQKQNSSS